MKQKRYLGLDLSGAKNAKTTLAVLEYYPKEEKVFLLDVYPGLGADVNASSDEVLIEAINEHVQEHPDLKLGVNVPLRLPPCFGCNKKSCAQSKECSLNEVKWMRQFTDKYRQTHRRQNVSKRTAKLKEYFTPYTQRPVELWLKYEVLSKLPEKLRFEVDETLGGNKAPLTARMHFLQTHLPEFEMLEVLPKLTVTLLMTQLKLSQRVMKQYRQMEEGAAARQTILERMAEHLDIFIYDRDMKKLTQNLNAFDAFLCAYTVLLCSRNECVVPPKHFPIQTGWVHYPKSALLEGKSGLDEAMESGEE